MVWVKFNLKGGENLKFQILFGKYYPGAVGQRYLIFGVGVPVLVLDTNVVGTAAVQKAVKPDIYGMAVRKHVIPQKIFPPVIGIRRADVEIIHVIAGIIGNTDRRKVLGGYRENPRQQKQNRYKQFLHDGPLINRSRKLPSFYPCSG
jgi:hypothetical protein